MRWREYLVATDPAEAEALVNALTVGVGTLGQLVRRIGRNEEHRAIVAALAAAELALDRAYRRLPDALDRPVVPVRQLPPVGQPWQSYLAGRSVQEVLVLQRELREIVRKAQLASELIQADGPVEELTTHLMALVERLQRLRLELVDG